MNIELEAALVIGAVIIVLGFVLYLPGKWYAKRKALKNLNNRISYKVTPYGIVLSVIMISFIIFSFSSTYFFPESYFGSFVSCKFGRLVYVLILAIVFYLIDKTMNKKGFKFLIEKDEIV